MKSRHLCYSINCTRVYLVFVHFSLQFHRHGCRLLQLPESVLPREQKLLKHVRLTPEKQKQKHDSQSSGGKIRTVPIQLKLRSINCRQKLNPLPKCDPVLLGLFCEALLPLLIQTPHLAVLVHVSFCLFCHREIWSPQVKIGTVLTEERRGEERRGEALSAVLTLIQKRKAMNSAH